MALTDAEEKEFKEKLTKALASVDSITADHATLKADNDRLNAKVAEANKHTKAAEKLAEDAAKKKATDDGNFEALFKSSEEARTALQTENDNMKSIHAKDKIKDEALKVAAKIADGENIGLLADFLGRRLKLVDGSVKVTNEDGEPTISTIDDLEKEFSGSARYASLLKGNKSLGGGAPPGGSNTGSAAKSMLRSEFDKLSPVDQTEFFNKDGKKTGNTISDE